MIVIGIYEILDAWYTNNTLIYGNMFCQSWIELDIMSLNSSRMITCPSLTQQIAMLSVRETHCKAARGCEIGGLRPL